MTTAPLSAQAAPLSHSPFCEPDDVLAVAATVLRLYVNIKKAKPTVLFVHTTAGVMHLMAHYVAYHHLKAMANV